MLDHRIETFLAVCRTLNYTRAAEELSLTQPAVSQHIAALERVRREAFPLSKQEARAHSCRRGACVRRGDAPRGGASQARPRRHARGEGGSVRRRHADGGRVPARRPARRVAGAASKRRCACGLGRYGASSFPHRRRHARLRADRGLFSTRASTTGRSFASSGSWGCALPQPPLPRAGGGMGRSSARASGGARGGIRHARAVRARDGAAQPIYRGVRPA